MISPIKVLIVDDSKMARAILKRGLEQFEDIQIIGTAADAYEARDMISRNKPDVLTLDIEMPKMNGLDFLRHLMSQVPIPVIMVSSFSEEGKQITMDALSFGAVDFVTKPLAQVQNSVQIMINELYKKVKMAASISPVKKVISPKKRSYPLSENIDKGIIFKKNAIVAIGASTGGTEAIKDIIRKLPSNFPPIVITQHMPKGFTRLFAKRLNDLSKITVIEAENGIQLKNGIAYIAPGGKQMGVKKGPHGKISINISDEKPQNGHKPSVGYLFNSFTRDLCSNLTAVILTGMGRDGADEIFRLKKDGVYTIAQDEETSIVFGMPGEAILLGGAQKILPLNTIAEHLIKQTKE